MQNLKLALIQADLFWEDIAKNLTAFDTKIEAVAKGTDLIVLPEMFNTGFSINPENISEQPEGYTFGWMQRKAKQKNAAITGSVITREKGRYFNRLYWVFPDGKFHYYDKKHLFRLGKEWQVFSAGSQKIIVEYKGWKICPLICYDLRFPVWSKNRMVDGEFEYDLLIYVANWPQIRSYVWKHLLIARALENQAFVVGVNRVGPDGNDILHTGDSMVLTAGGEILAQAKPFMEEILTADILKSDLEKFRDKFQFSLDWDEFTISGVG